VRWRVLMGFAVLTAGSPPACRGQAAQTPAEMGAMDSTDAPAANAAHEAMEDANGHFELVGAMYTAPARTSDDDLDRRIPLSVARWHEHVNWCLPPHGARALARATRRPAGLRAGVGDCDPGRV